MGAICYVGIEASARTQWGLLGAEIVILVIFSIVALTKVWTGHAPGGVHPALSWLNPFDISSFGAMSSGLLLAIFIYWGWDTAVSVNEETEDSTETPGRAAIVSTFLLLGIYLLVSVAAQAFHGINFLNNNSDDVLGALGKDVLGSPWDKLLIIAVLTSASASTQTTILPTTRVDALDGEPRRPAEELRQDPSALPDSERLDDLDVRGLDRRVRAAQHRLEQHPRGLRDLDRVRHRFLLRADRRSPAPGSSASSSSRASRNFFLVGLLPLLGGIILFAILGDSAYEAWNPGQLFDRQHLARHLRTARDGDLRPRDRGRDPGRLADHLAGAVLPLEDRSRRSRSARRPEGGGCRWLGRSCSGTTDPRAPHVALEKAIEVAQLEAARIVVVFAYEIPAAYGGETGDYRRAVRERAEEATARAVPRLDESGLEYAIELVPERPTEGLVDIADKTGASMIVVGTNGEHPIKGVVLGSVPHKLLHVSDVPVLVVPTSK